MRFRPLLAFACFLCALACLELAIRFAANGVLLASGLAMQGVWAGFAFAGALAAAGPPRESLALRRSGLRAGSLLVGLVGFVALSAALHDVLVALAVRDTGALAQIDQGVRQSHGGGRLLALVAVGLAPAFAEELLFRGFLQHWLLNRMRPAAALSLAALAFGIAHGDLVQGSAAVALGGYLGALVLFSGSLWPAVAAHLVNNLLAMLRVTAPALALPGGSARTWAAFALSAAALAWVWRRSRLRPPAPAQSPHAEVPTTDSASESAPPGRP